MAVVCSAVARGVGRTHAVLLHDVFIEILAFRRHLRIEFEGLELELDLELGADAVLVGRPILYGLATAGAEGVAGVLGLLRAELENGLALVGCARFDEVDAAVLRHDG